MLVSLLSVFPSSQPLIVLFTTAGEGGGFWSPSPDERRLIVKGSDEMEVLGSRLAETGIGPGCTVLLIG